MAQLSDAGWERLRELIASRQTELPSVLTPSDFLDNLARKAFRRYPPLLDFDDDEEVDEVGLDALDGGESAAADYICTRLTSAAASPYFPLVQQIALTNDDQAVEQLMALLDRHLRVRGILFRHRLDPDREYPGVWGKVWEAIPKWDGRDFRAYVARIIRNHCLDEIARKKKRPIGLEDDVRDGRPPAQSGSVAAARDALEFVMAVIDDLEASRRIKALDGVIFSLISQGRSVADVVRGFRTTDVPVRFSEAMSALSGLNTDSDATVLKLLLDGESLDERLTPAEIALVTQRDEAQVTACAEKLGWFDEPEERLLASLFARPGLSVKDLERARKLTTNAINLCINRIRLKVWMALIDRTYEALRRRGEITATELAVVQNRCILAPSAGCRMYKDGTCKREADPADIARKAGLDLDGEGVSRAMAELRRKVLEDGLAFNFPDYNACLTERKNPKKRT